MNIHEIKLPVNWNKRIYKESFLESCDIRKEELSQNGGIPITFGDNQTSSFIDLRKKVGVVSDIEEIGDELIATCKFFDSDIKRDAPTSPLELLQRNAPIEIRPRLLAREDDNDKLTSAKLICFDFDLHNFSKRDL